MGSATLSTVLAQYYTPPTDMKTLLLLLGLLASAMAAAPRPKNEFTCDLCVDIITDIDEFLTDDKTEDQIVDFAKQLCHAIGQIIDGFEATCNFIVQSQLPAIIESLVEEQLEPHTVCTDLLKACP